MRHWSDRAREGSRKSLRYHAGAPMKPLGDGSLAFQAFGTVMGAQRLVERERSQCRPAPPCVGATADGVVTCADATGAAVATTAATSAMASERRRSDIRRTAGAAR